MKDRLEQTIRLVNYTIARLQIPDQGELVEQLQDAEDILVELYNELDGREHEPSDYIYDQWKDKKILKENDK